MSRPVCPESPWKKWYATKVAAQAAALRMKWDYGEEQRAYKCPACPYYHLTSQPDSKERCA